jgi:uncharacterized protein (TIGR03437 family)
MMRRNRALVAVAVVALPVAFLWAHSKGPDVRHTGAPGDDPLACTASGCHDGTPLNTGGGNVVVQFPDGLTYTPGQQQTFTITITDSQAKLYGFQMTARLESDLENGQAGDFIGGTGQIVLCGAQLGPDDPGVFKQKGGCPAAFPVEFIEHYLAPFKTNVIKVLWTPPATNVGNVHIYIAANAAPSANGDTPNPHDHIYTNSYVLSPSCTDATPTVTAVQSAGAFNPKAGLASGTWLEIYGSNLTCYDARGWAGSDFNGNNAPTSLNKVTVTIGGNLAYIDYASPSQVNIQAPDDSNNGDGIPIVLTNSAGSSNTTSMQKNSIAPAVLAPSAFIVQGHQWVVAQHTDQTYVGKTNLISGLPFSPAKPGEIITIYGIGFGPVNPDTPAGTITPALQNSLVSTPTFRFGQTPAALQYDGLVPGFVGLYQFNLVVPKVGAGDMPLNVSVGAANLNQNLYITVGQ